MATNYPGSLDTSTQQPSPLSTTEMDDAGFEHDVVHTNHSGAIIALETKVGTGDSNAVADSVLAGTGSGTSAWTTGTLANDISGNATTATTATNLSGGSISATTGSFTGDVDIANATPILTFKDTNSTSTSNFGIKFTDSADTTLCRIHGGGSNDIRFEVAGNDVMAITDSERVGIGDTAPNSKLEVVTTGERAFRFDRAEDVGAASVTCGIMQIGTDTTNPGTNDYWILFRRGSATTVGSVRGTGSASVNFSTTSDATLKTDRGIATASRIGTIIDGLQVHEFDWIEGDVTDQIGLFAQEAIDVLPESIVNAPTVEPATADSEEQYVAAALDYSKIVPILIAECQFLRARVTALEAA